MRLIRITAVLVLAAASVMVGAAQNPPSTNQSPGAPGAPAAPGAPGAPGAVPPPGGRGGRGGGRGGVQVMTLTSTAWPDGGQVPAKYSQMGEEASPPFAWSNVPDNTQSFVLVVHDVDAAIGSGTDDILHWMLWNIPGSARSLPEKIGQATQLADGTRQISASGPYYRGPGAPGAGAAHHYVFELYALDTVLDVPTVGQSPPLTRAAVMSAMAGHIRGKAAYVGLFKRPAA